MNGIYLIELLLRVFSQRVANIMLGVLRCFTRMVSAGILLFVLGVSVFFDCFLSMTNSVKSGGDIERGFYERSGAT